MLHTKQRILIIGLVWPEPTSSAAGTRIIQIIKYFKSTGAEVYFASAANKSAYSFALKNLEVTEISIKLNSSDFNKVLIDINPNIVLYDRYISEEQYGWRVYENCRHALTILDTEDLHFLRYARQQSIKSGKDINLINDITKREIASILRCDISLIISEYEIQLLKDNFKIPEDLLFYLPFTEDVPSIEKTQHISGFEERKNVAFIGNFLHEPNWHTTLVLKNEIWPILRKLIPEAELHIYGSYMSEKVLNLNKSTDKFIVKGRAKNSIETLSEYRLLLAPIKFGAGTKGKLIDSMHSGTPNITTPIGAEGMFKDIWNGAIAMNNDDFITQSKRFYTDPTIWSKAQENGFQILNRNFNYETHIPKLHKFIKNKIENLEHIRNNNFMGLILHHHTTNSSKYMSLWIEEKNKKIN